MSDLYTNFRSPSLIIAGPGTGKTTSIISKILKLIYSLDIDSKGIIICTFTRKATEELKLRLFSEIDNKKLNNINYIIGTIHSICYELLTRYSKNNYENFQILSEETQVHFIYSKLSNLGFPEEEIRKQGWRIAELLTKLFNKITDEQINISDLDFNGDKDLEDYCKIYPTYKRIIFRKKLFDFASIQETLLKEIENDKCFLELINKDFKYFFIDEYQDVNNLQDTIFKKLSYPEYNITIVGDDDQSIYGFRGASVENILNFQEWFSIQGVQCKNFLLSTNYRSTKNIVKTTNHIIELSEYLRFNKNIQTNRSTVSHEPVTKCFNSDIEEAEYITNLIQNFYNYNIINSYSDIAILFRSVKNHSRSIIDNFDNNNIPYIQIGAESLFDSVIGEEFIMLLDFYLSKNNDKDKIFYEKIKEIDAVNGSDLTFTYTKNDYIERLKKLFSAKKFNSCIDLTYSIFAKTDFIDRYSEIGENLGIITSLILSFDDFSDYFDPYDLFSYLIYLKIYQQVDFISNEVDNTVQLMTIHKAKGLEFPVVIMPSQNERKSRVDISNRLNVISGQSQLLNDNEERRIFYVGATRAEDFLMVSYSKSLNSTNKVYEPNKFAAELIEYSGTSIEINYDLLTKQQFRNKRQYKNASLILSYNKISLYNQCPLSYLYSNIWNLSTVRIGGLEYGSNIHNIIETILKRVKEGIISKEINIEKIVADNWINKNFVSPSQNEKFKKSATKQIREFINRQTGLLQQEKIFSIEDEFNIFIGDDLITGRLDAVFWKDGKPLLLDFKTGDKKDYSNQLSFYALCFKEKYNFDDINTAVYFLRSGEFENIEPRPIEKEINNIKGVSQKIKNKLFPPNPGRHCYDCAYNNICKYAYKGT